MIFPKDFEIKVGFAPLRRLLTEKCETNLGGKKVEEMTFLTHREEIIKELGRTHEMKSLLESSISMPHFILFDVAGWLKEVKSPGSFLNSLQLYHTALTFHTMQEVSNFFKEETHAGVKLKYLSEFFNNLPEVVSLEREILRCVDKEGNVKDNASPRLYEIRGNIESLSRSMHKIMRRVIDSSINAGIIEKDATPVLREGRLVIPVSSAQKRGLSGIVHDTSATGKTVFIEPAEVVEAGNRLRELQKEEEQEIIIILTSLTDLLRPESENISHGCNLLSTYDFLKAKALFAIETGGELPSIEKIPELDWFHAVHPGLLLNLRIHGRETVAMNLKLDGKNRILIISGPNAGGKSVTLKTVGTVQYMMQCGMLPTLYSNSHMGIFTNLFIDIGDEQSMENDLSTYSSHLTNMKFLLQHADSSSLVLADEMGSGTEPQIGAALAQSILAKLGSSKCFGVITTHYQNLKVFAENEEGFINGAMLYDRQKLQPTFQLSVGEPGSSFALEIAQKIGLPAEVVENAKNIVGTDYVDAEKFLLDIQRDKRYWKNKRLEIKEKENRLNKLLETYEEKAEELKQQRQSIIKEAKHEAKEILKSANTQIERSIHEIRKSQADKEKSKSIRAELEEYKKSLEKEKPSDLPKALQPLKHKSRNKKQKPADNNSNFGSKSLEAGDFVRMDNGGVTGQIISIEGKKAVVAFGNLRTTTELSKLSPSKKPQESSKTQTIVSTQKVVDSSRQRQLNFKNEIDVRGFRADEAIQAITYFLDDANQFNAERVRILHGTGHGILRTLIRQQLQSNPNVRDFHDEDVRFGGAGITVVNLT